MDGACGPRADGFYPNTPLLHPYTICHTLTWHTAEQNLDATSWAHHLTQHPCPAYTKLSHHSRRTTRWLFLQTKQPTQATWSVKQLLCHPPYDHDARGAHISTQSLSALPKTRSGPLTIGPRKRWSLSLIFFASSTQVSAGTHTQD